MSDLRSACSPQDRMPDRREIIARAINPLEWSNIDARILRGWTREQAFNFDVRGQLSMEAADRVISALRTTPAVTSNSRKDAT